MKLRKLIQHLFLEWCGKEDNKVDLNKFAKDITLKEGKKKSLNIAQIKEVIRLTLLNLKDLTIEELTKLLKRLK